MNGLTRPADIIPMLFSIPSWVAEAPRATIYTETYGFTILRKKKCILERTAEIFQSRCCLLRNPYPLDKELTNLLVTCINNYTLMNRKRGKTACKRLSLIFDNEKTDK